MRLVPVGSLKNGTIIAKTIHNDHGNVLLKAGVSLSDSLIVKLIANDIVSVYIEDDYSLAEIKDVITPELRSKAVKEVKNVFESVQKNLKNQISDLKEDRTALKKRLKLMTDQRYFEKITDIIEEMMTDLSKNHDAMVGLVDIKSMNSYMYQHAVQVTVLSLIIGVDMKLSNKDLKELAIGAMLHDIGLSLIDSKLWILNDSFTEEEVEIYQSHPEAGYRFMKETSMLTGASAVAILEHHEKYNGRGYPLGRSGSKIHRNARIIAIADAYDMMTSGIDGHFNAQNEVIEYIMGNSGNQGDFDIEMATRFVRRVLPFPVGTYVKLSNGLVAIVVDYNANHPMRPVLRMVEEGKALENLLRIDLMDKKHYNITIVSTVY